MGDRPLEFGPARDMLLLLDLRDEIEGGPMKIVEARPGIAHANHGRGVAGGHPARGRGRKPEMLGQRKAGMKLVVDEEECGQEKSTCRGDGEPRRRPRGRRSGRQRRNRRSHSLRSSWRGGVPADRASARPTRISQSSISTATCSERSSSKLSRIKSPRANFKSCAVPAPTASKPPPASAPYAADREDRAPFLDPAKVAPSARGHAGLDLDEENVDTSG